MSGNLGFEDSRFDCFSVSSLEHPRGAETRFLQRKHVFKFIDQPILSLWSAGENVKVLEKATSSSKKVVSPYKKCCNFYSPKSPWAGAWCYDHETEKMLYTGKYYTDTNACFVFNYFTVPSDKDIHTEISIHQTIIITVRLMLITQTTSRSSIPWKLP